MSWFIGMLTQVKHALQTGWAYIVQGVVSVARPRKPCAVPGTVPVPAAIVKDETFTTIGTILRDPGVVRCPQAMSVPPLRPCQSAEVKRGSHAARALFHDAFKAPTAMGVFEITSNAFLPYPPEPSVSLGDHGIQSLSDNSSSIETQFTPIFDGDTSHPPSEISTTPTTPASILFSPTLIKSVFSSPTTNEWDSDDGDDDSIPLSVLMLRGARNTTKRHGLSGRIIGDKLDKPSWITSLQPSSSGPALTMLPRTFDNPSPSESTIRIGASQRKSCTIVIASSTSTAPIGDTCTQQNPTQVQVERSTSLACDANKPTLDADDCSVYSLESYVHTQKDVPFHPDSQPNLDSPVPEITFTPPSLPTSPAVDSDLTADAVSFFADQSSTDSFLAPALPEQVGCIAYDETPFNSNYLLVPALNIAVPDSDDDIDLKKRRRNACRMETSSIDIIMAGLDQVFPDSLYPTAAIQAEGQVECPVSLGDTSQGIPEGDLSAYSKACDARPFSPPLHRDLSAIESTMCMEESLESKFSDSEDEEGDDFFSPRTYGGLQDLHFRSSWPPLRAPVFDPSSVLSTIAEEEMDDDGKLHRQLGKKAAVDCIRLEPPAIIDEVELSDISSDISNRVSKRRWFSMIEAQVNVQNVNLPLGKIKHLSAPSWLNTGSPKLLSPRIVPGSGLVFDFSAEPSLISAIISADNAQPKSSMRPVILPKRLASNLSTPDMYTPDCRGRTSVCSVEIGSTLDLPLLNDSPPMAVHDCQVFDPSRNSSGTPSPSSSIYSEMSEPIIVLPLSPNVPDTTVEESVSTEWNPRNQLYLEDPNHGHHHDNLESGLLLHTVVSNPQGVSGILAILDSMEVDGLTMDRDRRTSLISAISGEIEWGNEYEESFVVGVAI